MNPSGMVGLSAASVCLAYGFLDDFMSDRHFRREALAELHAMLERKRPQRNVPISPRMGRRQHKRRRCPVRIRRNLRNLRGKRR